MSDYDYKAIDAVVNIWNEEALKQRPGWGDAFFQEKMNSKESTGNAIEIDDLMGILDDAGIERAFDWYRVFVGDAGTGAVVITRLVISFD
jgi:hypothetical protein